jgi:hypothetical protein
MNLSRFFKERFWGELPLFENGCEIGLNIASARKALVSNHKSSQFRQVKVCRILCHELIDRLVIGLPLRVLLVFGLFEEIGHGLKVIALWTHRPWNVKS